MKTKIRNVVATAGAFAVLSGCALTSVQTGAENRRLHQSHARDVHYSRQTSRVMIRCFPANLVGVLDHIQKVTGVRPVVTSGMRQHGRSHSEHRTCKAADIRVPGVSDRTVVAAARTAGGIGGIGVYCNGIVHVDVGPRREWAFCGDRKRNVAVNFYDSHTSKNVRVASE